MTMGIVQSRLLDPKKCWDDWISLGSLKKVRIQYQLDEILNPRTGLPPTSSAIQKSAYRWAIENQAEARKQLEEVWINIGIVPSDKRWRDQLFRMGKLNYYQSERKMNKFKVQNGLQGYA